MAYKARARLLLELAALSVKLVKILRLQMILVLSQTVWHLFGQRNAAVLNA